MAIKTGTIKQKILLPASPFEVYDAFIDEKKHSIFTGSKATCDPTVGGARQRADAGLGRDNNELTHAPPGRRAPDIGRTLGGDNATGRRLPEGGIGAGVSHQHNNVN